MKKTDSHLHLVKESSQDAPFVSADEMLPHLKELGIYKGILMSSGEDVPWGNNQNNWEICEKYPTIYYWMCNLDFKEPNTIFERLKFYKEKGAVGIGELMINKNINHPFIQEIFKSAEQLHMPVLFHMSPQIGFQYGIVDEPGLPLLEDALQKYPDLIFIGHSQPFWHEISKNPGYSLEERNNWGNGPVKNGGRLVYLFENYKNLYGDLSANSGGCAIMRDEDFGLYFLETYQDRLLFGTDMINTDMVFPLSQWLDTKADEGKLSRLAYEKISYLNSEKIFKIEKRSI